MRKLYTVTSDSITIHWHGQHQRGTPFMDGIGYISQCPVASGQSFTYEFKVVNYCMNHVGTQSLTTTLETPNHVFSVCLLYPSGSEFS